MLADFQKTARARIRMEQKCHRFASRDRGTKYCSRMNLSCWNVSIDFLTTEHRADADFSLA